MIANLTHTATLSGMTRLTEADEALREGAALTTPAASFDDREGYVPGFLPGWSIDLPVATGIGAADMRELRRGGQGVVLAYQHFSVIMSASRKMPMIAAANINGAQSRRMPRVKKWSYDGRLDEDDQWGEELYGGNALDRGHMVRREDPVWGTEAEAKTANIDTFHYTNACPQMGAMNQKTWLGLEDYILNNARADGLRVSVFTGPYFTEDDLTYREALIPRAFWKVVAIVLPDGRPSATAYQVSQEKELEDLEFVYAGYKTYQISIQQVIDKTGLDFNPLVPFDGFSQYETLTGMQLTETLDELSQIRV
ncbi:DNA/RNA non-specific endonuclease [Fibrivirga algicola]|uniref:DNA/RNA non-specific endonuclease n=1 Tax=Fibrivirga algicola TaxID=2950420 RepID=A0ABX0QM98_9BACT|nr:DNA/RNA non-specific endonuclease [Fibrivirga algicola]NID11264.1 DNA/RNA non-specific endonuclease [Fibrivirga algicola]